MTEATNKPRGNLVALGVTQAVVSGSGFVAQVILARWLGPESFGVLGFIVSVTSVLAFAADLNLQVLLAREIAREPETAPRRLGTGLMTIGMTSAVAVALSVALVGLMDGRSYVLLAALVAGFALATAAIKNIVESALQGLRTMQPLMIANFVGRVVYLVATLGLVFAGFDVIGVFVALVIGPLVTSGMLLVWFRRNVGKLERDPISAVPARIRESIPFAMSGLFASVYLASDVLVIKAFWGDDEVGVYRAASLLLMQLGVLAVMLSRGIYPRLAQSLNDPVAAGADVAFTGRIIAVVAVPLGVGGALVGHDLLPLLVGEGYEAGILPFIVLMPILPIRFLNNLLGSSLSALNLQEARTKGAAIAAALNVGSNLAVVPFFGALGAAVTTLASDICLLLYQAWRLAPLVQKVAIWGPLLRLIPATLVMAGLVWVLGDIHVVVRIAVAGAGYGVVALLTRVVSLKDLRELRSI